MIASTPFPFDSSKSTAIEHTQDQLGKVTRSPLDLDQATMQRLGHQVTDIVAEHLATIRDEPVIATAPRSELNRALMKPAPQDPSDFDSIIEVLRKTVFPYHAREPHPGFLAYVSSCPTFPSLVGDWLATGYNFFAGVWPVAAGPNEIEMVVLEWIRSWTGLPQGSGGLLTTGGSAANMTAVVAARHRAVEAGADISRLTVYTTAQAHSSAVRAAWIAGIRRENVRNVEMDALFRMRPDDLAAAIQADRKKGLEPFLVIASAGTTNTGSVDPLDGISAVCERESLWLHVDAAYAGFAVLTEEGKRMLGRLDLADSVTLDPHKWLFVPFECGCLMLRDPSRLADAFRIMPEYLKDVEAGEAEVNFADRGFSSLVIRGRSRSGSRSIILEPGQSQPKFRMRWNALGCSSLSSETQTISNRCVQRSLEFSVSALDQTA